ncbi:hypothetical protein JCM10213v2_003573 [Rhodosporidiobolus nylandii]
MSFQLSDASWGFGELAGLIRDAEGVVDLDLMAWEEEAPHLRRLVIEALHLPWSLFTAFPSFPHLTELSLYYAGIEPWNFDSLISPATTPSLRALFFTNLYSPRISGREYYFPDLPDSLLERLDMLHVYCPRASDLSLRILLSATAVLVSHNIEDDLEPFDAVAEDDKPIYPPHIKLTCICECAVEDEYFNSIPSDRYNLAETLLQMSNVLVNDGPTNIRSIHLPPDLDSSSAAYPRVPPMLRYAVETLVKECSRHEPPVEIGWIDEEDLGATRVSRAFWRWVQERKKAGLP